MTVLPPPLFDLNPEPDWLHAARLHNAGGPFTTAPHPAYCWNQQYGYLRDAPPRCDAWVWHFCTRPTSHDNQHKCDRCEETW